jgi:hypothetical protein
MTALLAAALTFVIVFWAVFELGQPFIRWGWSDAQQVQGAGQPDASGGTWRIVSNGAKATFVYEPRSDA